MDVLSRQAIVGRLDTRRLAHKVLFFDEIDSTNTLAVKLAQEGAAEGLLVIADSQRSGRGRLDRTWHAPAGSSLLFSLLLRPPLLLGQAQRATMLCALAAVRAIRDVARVQARVKWPNDLVVDGKKLGGVLTEIRPRGQQLDYAVVGMGINVNLDLTELPQVMSPPTSLLAERGEPVSRLDLLTRLLQEVDALYDEMLAGWSPHAAWREHLDTIGKSVAVGTREEVIRGVAESVDENGALLVRDEDGVLHTILVGDVTLRGHRT